MARHAKKIDTVHWTYGFASALSLGAGTVAANVLSAQHLPETLMRTRGELLVNVNGAIGTNLMCAVGVGLILVPEGTGTTVLWSPITDGDAPWFWVEYCAIGNQESVADVINSPILAACRKLIDSKAMRKVRNREVQFVAENASIEGVPSVDIVLNVRFLAGS